MHEFILNEEMFLDFQEGLKDIEKLNRDPSDEVARKRIAKKWENNSARDILVLFMSADSTE